MTDGVEGCVDILCCITGTFHSGALPRKSVTTAEPAPCDCLIVATNAIQCAPAKFSYVACWRLGNGTAAGAADHDTTMRWKPSGSRTGTKHTRGEERHRALPLTKLILSSGGARLTLRFLRKSYIGLPSGLYPAHSPVLLLLHLSGQGSIVCCLSLAPPLCLPDLRQRHRYRLLGQFIW